LLYEENKFYNVSGLTTRTLSKQNIRQAKDMPGR